MRRRTLLATIAASATGAAGCLGEGTDPVGTGTEDGDDGAGGADGKEDDPDGPGADESGSGSGSDGSGDDAGPESGSDDAPEPEDRRYDECHREVIPYEQFPEDVRAEIDAALEAPYEADRVYLREAMAVEESFLSVEGEYYRALIAVEDGREVLTLDRVQPKALPDPRPVSVELRREGERTITVEVVADDGTVLIDETREQRAGGEVEYGRTARVGTHDLHLTVERDGEVETETTLSARIDESLFSVIVLIEPEGASLTGAVAELGECRFDAGQ